jgi:hypothetical protein
MSEQALLVTFPDLPLPIGQGSPSLTMLGATCDGSSTCVCPPPPHPSYFHSPHPAMLLGEVRNE